MQYAGKRVNHSRLDNIQRDFHKSIYIGQSVILPKEIIAPAIGLTDQYFDLKGLSAYSSLGVSTLRCYIRKGWIPSFKVKGKVLVKKSHFDEIMNRRFRVNKSEDLRRLVGETMAQLKRAKKQ